MLQRNFCRAAAVAHGNVNAKMYSTTQQPRIMITGACGQIGTELITKLRSKFGANNVVATDVKKPDHPAFQDGPFEYANVLDYNSMERIVVEHGITWLIHNSSILSARGEQNFDLSFNVNILGIRNALELAKFHQLRILAPSSIAAFGPSTPLDNTPDFTIQRPTTIYGVSKVFVELLGEYYHKRWGVDFRSLRYPGIISADSDPGGGTTDYAVQIFHDALSAIPHHYCFLQQNTRLPMMYMDDCIDATLGLMEADNSILKQRTYNVAGISFTPRELFEAIQKRIPALTITYQPDFRQEIADSWPRALDDTNARRDWNWKPKYEMDALVDTMIVRLKARLQAQRAIIKK